MLVNSIRILKDEDYQKKVWFRKEGYDESCYSETVFHFLESSEKILNDQHHVGLLGEQIFFILNELYNLVKEHIDLLEEYCDPDLLEENELLDDPKWKTIQAHAEKLFIKLSTFVSRKTKEN